MKLSLKLLGVVLFLAIASSCKKDTPFVEPVEPEEPGGPITPEPGDSLTTYPLSAPPKSIVYEGQGYTYNLDFEYTGNAIAVKLNDVPRINYTYSDGYLTSVAFLDAIGNGAGNFAIERSGNTITRVFVTHQTGSYVERDTMVVSFADSSNHTLMSVTSRFFGTTSASVKYTFNQRSQLKSIKGTDANGVFFPSYQFTYDIANRLALKSTNSYYGTAYDYGDAGSGLDSLFLLLGGKDGHFVEGLMLYDDELSLFFSPLQIFLQDAGIQLDALTHRYGALREVKSVPSYPDYTLVKVFSFQNTFNDDDQVVTSRIISDGQQYAMYWFSY